MFEPVEIRYSKRKALWGLASGVVLCLMVFSAPPRGRWAWAFYAVLLLLNSLFIVKAWFNHGVVLVIDDQGVRDLRLGGAPIPWKRIESASLHKDERIFLNLTEASYLGLEENRLSILYKPISKTGKDGVLIDARGLEVDSDHIVGLVEERMSYHRENRHR